MRKLSHYLALTCLLVGCAHKKTTGSKEKEITTRLSTPSIWREVAQAKKSEALPNFGDRNEIQFKSSECHCKIKSIKTGVEKIESDCEL